MNTSLPRKLAELLSKVESTLNIDNPKAVEYVCYITEHSLAEAKERFDPATREIVVALLQMMVDKTIVEAGVIATEKKD